MRANYGNNLLYIWEGDDMAFNNLKISPRLKKNIIILNIIVFLVIAMSLLITFLSKHPYLWHYQASRNRMAILEYAADNYPRARIVEETYSSTVFNPTNKPYDKIRFELDGINFWIKARDGEVDWRDDDGYGGALIGKEIREKYIDNYLLSNSLACNARIRYSGYQPTKNDTLASFVSFDGAIVLEFDLAYEENELSVPDYDWYYDFYCYWKEICPTREFILWFRYWTDWQSKYLLYCDSGSEFNSKEAFFSASEKIPL